MKKTQPMPKLALYGLMSLCIAVGMSLAQLREYLSSSLQEILSLELIKSGFFYLAIILFITTAIANKKNTK